MLIATQVIRILENQKITPFSLLQIIIFGYILFLIKYYYAAILIPVIISLLIVKLFLIKFRIIAQSKFTQSITFLVLLIGIVLLASRLHPNLHLTNISEVIVNNYQLFEQKSEPDKMVHFDHLKPQFSSFLYYTPKALFTGWFRPFIFDMTNIWTLLSAIENALLLFFLIFQIPRMKKLFGENFLLVSGVLIYCAVMAIFLSYSAPNFGTLVRYKVGYLPFLVMVILNRNIVFERLAKKIRDLKNPG